MARPPVSSSKAGKDELPTTLPPTSARQYSLSTPAGVITCQACELHIDAVVNHNSKAASTVC